MNKREIGFVYQENIQQTSAVKEFIEFYQNRS